MAQTRNHAINLNAVQHQSLSRRDVQAFQQHNKPPVSLCKTSLQERRAATFRRATYLSIPIVIAASILLLGFKPALANEACSPNAPTPNISATPQEVVKTVINALRDNDKDNTGIATVFCFASPSNKSVTGPLERFTAMITGGYSVMLNHAYNYVEEMKVEGDTAMQVVWLVAADGKEYGYLFTMGKQKDGDFADMWMTEAVMPIERKGTQGLGI